MSEVLISASKKNDDKGLGTCHLSNFWFPYGCSTSPSLNLPINTFTGRIGWGERVRAVELVIVQAKQERRCEVNEFGHAGMRA